MYFFEIDANIFYRIENSIIDFGIWSFICQVLWTNLPRAFEPLCLALSWLLIVRFETIKCLARQKSAVRIKSSVCC